MRESHCFASARTCYHQQGTRSKPAPLALLSILGGEPLRRIQKTQMI
jgi:hypothetical protein